MLKIIIIISSTMLLTSCFEVFTNDTTPNNVKNDNYKKVTPNSSGVVIEDRSDLTKENIANNNGGSFEMQSQQNINKIKQITNSPEQLAVNNLKTQGVQFILYFPYNDFEIDEKSTQEIIKHANFMRENPNLNLRLEGHADERGTREYNLALGENRAISVKEILGLYGLSSRVEAISFGEENPVDVSHNQEAWAKNRRVVFVYK